MSGLTARVQGVDVYSVNVRGVPTNTMVRLDAHHLAITRHVMVTRSLELLLKPPAVVIAEKGVIVTTQPMPHFHRELQKVKQLLFPVLNQE